MHEQKLNYYSHFPRWNYYEQSSMAYILSFSTCFLQSSSQLITITYMASRVKKTELKLFENFVQLSLPYHKQKQSVYPCNLISLPLLPTFYWSLSFPCSLCHAFQFISVLLSGILFSLSIFFFTFFISTGIWFGAEKIKLASRVDYSIYLCRQFAWHIKSFLFRFIFRYVCHM